MLKLFTLLLVCISFQCFSQSTGNILSLNADNYKVKGICNGVRLDTLKSRFITVWISSGERLTTDSYYIDYGQFSTKEKINDLKDEANNYIEFASLTVLLNFMNYNGWTYQNSLVSQHIRTFYGNTKFGNNVILFFYKAKDQTLGVF